MEENKESVDERRNKLPFVYKLFGAISGTILILGLIICNILKYLAQGIMVLVLFSIAMILGYMIFIKLAYGYEVGFWELIRAIYLYIVQ